MAKKVLTEIKLQAVGGQASPAPPVGPALGQHGVNIMEFVKAFNAQTQSDAGTVIPVVITVYEDRSFTFVTKSPPAAVLIKQALSLEKGSAEPHRDKVATITRDQLNAIAEKKMADLLYREAEEHDSRRIARAIVRARPIRDTAHLATVVAGARKQWGRQRLHPATKTFLALRIAVNRELEALGQFLDRVPATLASGGRWVVISYHSLEDRLVKQKFRQLSATGAFEVLTRRVIMPSDAEIAANPRARSAKMRVAQKVVPAAMPAEA